MISMLRHAVDIGWLDVVPEARHVPLGDVLLPILREWRIRSS